MTLLLKEPTVTAVQREGMSREPREFAFEMRPRVGSLSPA